MPENNTCESCANWQKISPGGARVLNLAVGECHGGPPSADFKFPRTKACDSCAQHTGKVAAFATARAEQAAAQMPRRNRRGE